VEGRDGLEREDKTRDDEEERLCRGGHRGRRLGFWGGGLVLGMDQVDGGRGAR